MDFVIVTVVGIICGILSWKIVCDKEEQRRKECCAIGKDVCIPKMKWQNKILPGLMLVTPPFFITAMEGEGMNDGIFYTLMCYFVSIMSVCALFAFVRAFSIFGIVDKEIFVWKYYGFAHPQRYPMQELTRKEYYGTDKDGKPTHRIELFQKNELIRTIAPSAYYSETERIVELLRQIPGEIFKDKNFKKQEEIEKREERLQQILKEENIKN